MGMYNIRMLFQRKFKGSVCGGGTSCDRRTFVAAPPDLCSAWVIIRGQVGTMMEHDTDDILAMEADIDDCEDECLRRTI